MNDEPPQADGERRIAQLPSADIERMLARNHDLDYQHRLCESMMEQGLIFPFPFERAVTLLCEAGRYLEALEICRYVDQTCVLLEREWDGWSPQVWLDPQLAKCRSRIRLLELKPPR